MKQLAVGEPAPALPRPPLGVDADRADAFARELPLVEGAITLVASGAAPRVALVGLNGGLPLARLAKGLGRRAGLIVLARRHGDPGRPDDRRVDLIVEQDG